MSDWCPRCQKYVELDTAGICPSCNINITSSAEFPRTDIEIGWKRLECGHIVPIKNEYLPCPVCAEIRAAREEVLKMAKWVIGSVLASVMTDIFKSLEIDVWTHSDDAETINNNRLLRVLDTAYQQKYGSNDDRNTE